MRNTHSRPPVLFVLFLRCFYIPMSTAFTVQVGQKLSSHFHYYYFCACLKFSIHKPVAYRLRIRLDNLLILYFLEGGTCPFLTLHYTVKLYFYSIVNFDKLQASWKVQFYDSIKISDLF
jgi:hypothetical protein